VGLSGGDAPAAGGGGGSLRWGLLSTARINHALAAGARESAAAEIVAVASRERARAEAHARELGVERVHGSYEALLADPEVDAVYVSLPNALHVEWTVRALEAGKHVLCEKPLSRRAVDAEAAFAAADRSGRVLAEAFMWRHHPQARRLEALVREGAIGRLRLVRACFSFALRDERDVRLSADLDGGALMDVGTYCLSGARLLAGEPVRVYGEQELSAGGVDVAFAATLRFGDDVLASLDCGFGVPARDELEAIGEEGSLFLDDPWHGRAPGLELRRPDGTEESIAVEAADPYRLELEDFARATRGETPALLGRADAVGQARALEALYASAASGQPVALSERSST